MRRRSDSPRVAVVAVHRHDCSTPRAPTPPQRAAYAARGAFMTALAPAARHGAAPGAAAAAAARLCELHSPQLEPRDAFDRLLRAPPRRHRPRQRDGAPCGPRRGARRRVLGYRAGCCTETRPCARRRPQQTAASSTTRASCATRSNCATMRRRQGPFLIGLTRTSVKKAHRPGRAPQMRPRRDNIDQMQRGTRALLDSRRAGGDSSVE